MLLLGVQMRDSFDPEGVSDGLRLEACQTLSIECPSSIFFWLVLCVSFPFIFVVFVSLVGAL